MVILLPILFGQAVIKEPLVVECHPKTGVFAWEFFSRPMNMKELCLLFENTWSKYGHIIYFHLVYFNFLRFKIDHFGIITKRRSALKKIPC